MTDQPPVELAVVEMADAAEVVEVIHAAFGARAHVDPPPPALSETTESIAAEIARGSGVVARVDGRLAGNILLTDRGEGTVLLQRVCVHPDYQRHGIATLLTEAVQEVAADLGYRRAELFARREFPQVVAWWQRRGYRIVEKFPHGFLMHRHLPWPIDVPTSDAMQELGRRLAAYLRAGDVIIASGDLGAGKTTFTQGLGEGLGVPGPVVSPTFVLSRVHENPGDGPDLVHVDAYRLADDAELTDIDLDSDLDRSVTVVEWGAGLAEGLSADRLEIDIQRSLDEGDESRRIYLTAVGERWDGVDFSALGEGLAQEEA